MIDKFTLKLYHVPHGLRNGGGQRIKKEIRIMPNLTLMKNCCFRSEKQLFGKY